MKSIKLFTAAMILASSFQAAAQIKPLNSVAAEVNASIITVGDIERAMRLLRQDSASKTISDTQLADIAKQRLIERALMVDAAQNRGLRVTPAEIDVEIQRRAAISQKNVADIYTQAKSMGWGRENYRLEVAKDILMERVIALTMEDVQVSDSKVQNYIEQSKKDGTALPEGSPYTVYQIQRIVMNINNNNQASVVGERMNAIAQSLQQGGDFTSLAKRYSQDAAAAKGGLQEVNEGLESDKVDAMLQIVPIGQISAPIQTARNWQMFKMVGKRTENSPAKMQEYAIRRLLLKQEQRKAQEQFLGGLQHNAVVQTY